MECKTVSAGGKKRIRKISRTEPLHGVLLNIESDHVCLAENNNRPTTQIGRMRCARAVQNVRMSAQLVPDVFGQESATLCERRKKGHGRDLRRERQERRRHTTDWT